MCPLPRPQKRIVPLVPMRLRTLGEPDVMEMSFGTNIVPSTQQLYRISGKGGGQRDPRMYAADYKPSIPDELAQTPPSRTPPRHATASRQNVTGDSPVAPATPVGLPLGAVCSPRRLHFDSTMDGVDGLAAEPATGGTPTQESAESGTDQCSATGSEDDDSTEYDYPSSESWAPTPQHRSKPRALPGSPPVKQGTKAKKMRRSKHCASNLSDAPTTICLRDREVTRRRIVLSELNIRRRNNDPQDPLPPVVVTADSKRGRTRLRAEVDALTPRRRELSPVLRVCVWDPTQHPAKWRPGPRAAGVRGHPAGETLQSCPAAAAGGRVSCSPEIPDAAMEATRAPSAEPPRPVCECSGPDGT